MGVALVMGLEDTCGARMGRIFTNHFSLRHPVHLLGNIMDIFRREKHLVS